MKHSELVLRFKLTPEEDCSVTRPFDLLHKLTAAAGDDVEIVVLESVLVDLDEGQTLDVSAEVVSA